MSDPDVERAGWATTGSTLRRQRNPLLGVLAALLLGGGTAAAGAGLVRAIDEAAPSPDEIVAAGMAAGLNGPDAQPARFVAPQAGSFTVWLRLDGVRDSVYEQVVGSVACEVSRDDGGRARFRGNIQGTSIRVENLATVGVFRVPPGTATVACRQMPFGRRGRVQRLGGQKAFVVVPGRPSERTGPFLWLLGGIAAVVAGVPLALRWRSGRLVETGA